MTQNLYYLPDVKRELVGAARQIGSGFSVRIGGGQPEPITILRHKNGEESVISRLVFRSDDKPVSKAALRRILRRLEADGVDETLMAEVRRRFEKELNLTTDVRISNPLRIIRPAVLTATKRKIRNEGPTESRGLAQYLRILDSQQPVGTYLVVGLLTYAATDSLLGFLAGCLVIPLIKWIAEKSTEASND